MRFHNEPNTPTSANASCNLGRRTRNSNIARALVIGIWITISLLLGQSVNAAPAGKTWVSFSGDWDGDGIQTPGLYNRATSTFFLYAANAAGGASSIIQFGQARWWPVTGDWNGDGIDTIGVYNPDKGRFFLRMENASTLGQINFRFGTRRSHPISGDWDGDGVDTVGVYNRYVAVAELQATLGKGQASAKFQFGQAGWLPISGDWDGNGVDSLGVVNPTTGRFFLRNAHSTGPSDFQPLIKPTAEGSWPLVGRWDGTDQAGGDGIGIFQADGLRVSIRSALSSGAADATFGLSTELAEPSAPPSAAEIPAAPSNLTAAATAPNRVQVAWSDRSDNETGFDLQRVLPNSGTVFDTVASLGADIQGYADTNVSEGMEFCYRIRAHNATGASNFSNTQCATTPLSPQPPKATDDAFTVSQDSSENLLAVLANDSDPNSEDALNIVEATVSGSGTVRIAGTQLAYTPIAGFHGTESINYTITDRSGATASARVAITVSQAPNQAPIALDDAFTVAYGSHSNVLAVLANDTDPDSEDTLSISQASSSGTGTVSVTGSQLSYTPANGFQGIETLNYTIGDGRGATDGAKAIVTVSAPPPPAAPADLSASVPSADQVTLTWSDRSDNETGFELQRSKSGSTGPFTTLATLGANATAYADTDVAEATEYCYRLRAIGAGGASSFSGTPCATTPTESVALEGMAAYNFEETSGSLVIDRSSNANNGLLAGNVSRTEDGAIGSGVVFPGASGAYVDLNNLDIAGSQMTISLWFRANGFGDPEARLISKATGTANSAHYWMISTLEIGGAMRLRFRLKTSSGGTETLVATEGPALRAGALTHVAATYDGTYMSIYQNGALVGRTAKTGQLEVNPAVKAWVGGNPGGARPFDGMIDEVRIYGEARTTAQILNEIPSDLVEPAPNQAPIAKNDAFTVSQDSSGNLLAVLANDTDPDSGDTLKIVAASADRGAVSISGSKLSYSPGAGFAGSATINYTVADLAGARSTATAAVTVTATPAPDDKPSANPDSATTERDVAVTISVLANDTGLADGPISVSLVQPPSSGSASITSGGAIVYQPSGGFVGGDTLSYRVMDKDGDSAVSTVSVDVKCTACPPAQSNLTLSWDPSSGQVEGYRVYYGPTPETSILEISDLNQASGDLDLLAPSKRYRVEEDLGLKAGEQGCFRVRAYNIYGVSEYSDSACAQL